MILKTKACARKWTLEVLNIIFMFALLSQPVNVILQSSQMITIATVTKRPHRYFGTLWLSEYHDSIVKWPWQVIESFALYHKTGHTAFKLTWWDSFSTWRNDNLGGKRYIWLSFIVTFGSRCYQSTWILIISGLK